MGTGNRFNEQEDVNPSEVSRDQANIRGTWGDQDWADNWDEGILNAGALPASYWQSTGSQAATRLHSGPSPADTTTWQTSVPMTDQGHPDSMRPSGDPFVDMIRSQAQGRGEDFGRFSNAQILAWKGSYDQAASEQAGRPVFRNDFGDLVDKPTESGALSAAAGYATGERSAGRPGGGGGGGGYSGGGGAGVSSGSVGGLYGGAPGFQYDPFKPPLPGDTTTDPSYLFRVDEGRKALERSASARGVLRTGGTLQDILDYGQKAASQEYQNIYDRGLSTWGAQYQGQKDAFAPQYGSWETTYGGDLSKYLQSEGADLSRYLQREGHIFGTLNQPPPPYYG